MGYVRFVIQRNDCDSGQRQGLFQALSALERLDELRSKPHAKRVALSWFKDTATEYIRRMRELADILHAHGIETEMLSTDRPGYVVYEDAHQVAAEPFNDTGA
jgi:hypothetical protein